MANDSLMSVMAAGLARRPKALSTIDSRGGGWFNILREPFGGAWQRVLDVDAPRQVLAFSAVFACVTRIASDIAKLRIKLMRDDDDGIGEEIKTNSPFLPFLRKPNRYQNRIKFIEQYIVSKLLYGNVYVLKQRDQRGVVTAGYILDAQRVTPLVTASGDVYYKLSSDHLSGVEEAVTVPASEIIHDMMVSLWHPLVGVSPMYACGLSAMMGNRIQQNSTTFFGNMSRPSGTLTADGEISDDTANRLKEEWEKNYSGTNIGRVAVLGDGLKYDAMGVAPHDAQLIDQLKWTIEDVARCFDMPLFKIGGTLPPGSTIEVLNQSYYTDCLQTLIESAELCLDEGLDLPQLGYYTEFDLDGLLRMDQVAQMTMLSESVKGSIRAPNEARKKLNLKPAAGGNSPMAQQQNFSLAALAKRDALPNPFIIDRPTANPTPSGSGPATTADPAAPAAATEPGVKLSVEEMEFETTRMLEAELA